MGFADTFTDFLSSLSFTELHAEAPPKEDEEEGGDGGGSEEEGGAEKEEGGDGEGEEGGDAGEGGDDEGGEAEGEEEEEEEEEEDEPVDPKPRLEEGMYIINHPKPLNGCCNSIEELFFLQWRHPRKHSLPHCVLPPRCNHPHFQPILKPITHQPRLSSLT